MQRAAEELAGGHSHRGRERRGNRRLTEDVVAPADHGAVAAERDGVVVAGVDRDHRGESGGHAAHLRVAVATPADHGAVDLQCRGVGESETDVAHGAQGRGLRELAERVRAPSRRGLAVRGCRKQRREREARACDGGKPGRPRVARRLGAPHAVVPVGVRSIAAVVLCVVMHRGRSLSPNCPTHGTDDERPSDGVVRGAATTERGTGCEAVVRCPPHGGPRSCDGGRGAPHGYRGRARIPSDCGKEVTDSRPPNR